MSLSSLRSFTGAASLATTAFDTARTTLKAMAEAAVPPAGSDVATGTAADRPGAVRDGLPAGERRTEDDRIGSPGGEAERNGPPAGERMMEAERPAAEKPKRGVRQGTVLDAYA